MNFPAILTLVFFVALINLSLGFALAVHMGRGPWSRFAHRQLPNHAPRSTARALIMQTMDQLVRELETLEDCFQELLQRFSESPADSTSLEELLSILRTMMNRVESLTTDESDENHEQATAGLRKFGKVLHSAIAELERTVSNRGGSFPDPVPLLSSVQRECHGIRTTFDALLLAELPH